METIRLNQGNYTAWTFRRQLLHALGKDLSDEMRWLNSVALDMEKNYQIWHHRRCVFEMWMRGLPDQIPEEEKDQVSNNPKFTRKQAIDFEISLLYEIFDSDAKNYHAWSHKIWMVERYELWSDPRHLEFVDKMLDDDVQNNSVWSFRYFIVMRSSNNGAL